ncbi:hypothetical protein [Qipengyuania sp. DGS5-3]|uniref:hypothetical protein n=1 Tax=Qipengyuania sp. DGS5-3 TaxID=3349632 RepID=UPI0036D28ED6
MSIELVASSLASAAGSGAGGQNGGQVISLGPSGSSAAVSGTEAGRFASAMDKASSASAASRSDLPAPVGNLLRALDGIDVQARSVTDFAQSASASNGELTPGEIVQLTMKCQEFMFQCQLTSNIANRSADGVQQLFRQQG